MTEAAFPLLGPALVVGVVLPISALLVRIGLELAHRLVPNAALHGLRARYLVLLASSLLPIAWLLSAALHQAETGLSVLACIVDHGLDPNCIEPRLFGLALVVTMSVLALPTLVRALGGSIKGRESGIGAEQDRVRALIERTPWLAELRGLVIVSDGFGPAIATHGILRPSVVVRASYLDGLDDAALAAALCHELEHVRYRDPLRYLLVSLALALNPIGRLWLGSEVRRWIAAREAECDHDAVIRGADPAALAHALILAARPMDADVPIPALATAELAILQLRVELLMAYAERRSASLATRSRPALRLAGALLAVVIAWPHSGETAALDVLHTSAEGVVATILPPASGR